MAHRLKRTQKKTDGMKAAHQEYCRSEHWQTVRKFVLARNDHRCVLCNRTAVQVHHRSYDHTGNFDLEIHDCVSLCKRCHNNFHASARLAKTAVVMNDLVYDPQRGGYWKNPRNLSG